MDFYPSLSVHRRCLSQKQIYQQRDKQFSKHNGTTCAAKQQGLGVCEHALVGCVKDDGRAV